MIKGIYKSMKNSEKRPSTDVAYLKGSEDPQLKADVKKAISTHHATGNNLLNVLYNKDKELYKKLDAMGTTNAEQFINQLAYGEDEDNTSEENYQKFTSRLNAEQRKKWEEKAANPSETVASLKNFITSMSEPEAKQNPHADEIVEIYKTELEKRNKNPNYRPEKLYE